jgi:hypothetical protein
MTTTTPSRTLAAGEPCPCRPRARNTAGRVTGLLSPDNDCILCEGQGRVHEYLSGYAFAPGSPCPCATPEVLNGRDKRDCNVCKGAGVVGEGWGSERPKLGRTHGTYCDCTATSAFLGSRPELRHHFRAVAGAGIWADSRCSACRGSGHREVRTVEPVGKTGEALAPRLGDHIARLGKPEHLPTIMTEEESAKVQPWIGERTITHVSSVERSFRFTGDRAFDLHRLEQEIEETFKHLPSQRPAGFPTSRELAEEVMRARERGTTANPEWVSFLDNLRPLGVADFQRAKQRLREAIGADAAMSGTVAGDEVKAGQMVKVDDQGKVRAANPLPVGSSLASMLVHQSIRERWMREDAERFGMGGLFSERFLTKPAPEPKPNQQLDNIAKVHGLTRYAGESDDDLRTRVIRHAERRGVPLDLPIKVTGKVSVGVDRGAGDRSELAVCMMSAGRVERMYTGDQARRFLAHIEAFDKPKLWTELDPQRLRVEQAHVMREAADQVERRQKFYTEGSYARAALGTAAEVLADIARQVQRGTPLAEVGTPPPRGGERAEPAPPIAYPTLNPPRSRGERLSFETVREVATRLWQEKNPAGRVIIDRVSRAGKGQPLCYTDERKAVLLRVELGTWSDETVFAEGPSAEDIEQNIEAAWREVSGEIARGWKP